MSRSFIIQGHICHAPEAGSLEIRENAFVICADGICRGVFNGVPERFRGLEIIDCRGKLVMPGMVDLHIHAPQYAYRGTGMDYELLDWLNKVAFPEEIRYEDAEYAAEAYGIFARKMKRSATTRAVIFGTVHTDAALILADRMEKSGLVSFVGKVSMDRDSMPELTERSVEQAAAEARRFITESRRRGYRKTGPIVTPRFVPSCSAGLMAELGKIRKEYGLPVQSHLSENPDEVELVSRLEPEAAFYGDAYDRFGLFGREGRTVSSRAVGSEASSSTSASNS